MYHLHMTCNASVPRVSAASKTPPSNLRPTTEVPVTIGCLQSKQTSLSAHISVPKRRRDEGKMNKNDRTLYVFSAFCTLPMNESINQSIKINKNKRNVKGQGSFSFVIFFFSPFLYHTHT